MLAGPHHLRMQRLEVITVRNVCAEYESEGFLTCCRTGDMMRHGYYMTRNRAFLCEEAAAKEDCIKSEWTVVIPHRFVAQIERELDDHRYNAWYLYGRSIPTMGSEKGRWMVERIIQWDRDSLGRPAFITGRHVSEVAEALNGRICVGTLITANAVTDPPSETTLRLIGRTRTPNVCLLKNDGSWENISFHRDGKTMDVMATILLGEGQS